MLKSLAKDLDKNPTAKHHWYRFQVSLTHKLLLRVAMVGRDEELVEECSQVSSSSLWSGKRPCSSVKKPSPCLDFYSGCPGDGRCQCPSLWSFMIERNSMFERGDTGHLNICFSSLSIVFNRGRKVLSPHKQDAFTIMKLLACSSVLGSKLSSFIFDPSCLSRILFFFLVSNRQEEQ